MARLVTLVTCPTCGDAEYVEIRAAAPRDGVRRWAASCTGCGLGWEFDD